MDKNSILKVVKEVGNVTKKIIKSAIKPILITVSAVFGVVLLIVGIIYYLTLDDSSYKEGDWSSTPYASSQYTRNVSIGSDGSITTSMTAQEIWDTMLENNSRVDEYLDGPEELLKLMNAEIVTQYPDTRADPDEEIDWDAINNDVDSNNIQGIIKFARAQSDGTTTRMTFVDYGTFFNWIEEYNITGDESIREKLLTHFTIEASTVRTSTATTTLDYSGENQWTDISEAIVAAAFESYYAQNSPGAGLCQAWVRQVYTAAGLPDVGYIGAYQAFQATCVSTDMTNIPIGAAVYGTGSASYKGGANIYGHVGIYIGDIDGDGEGEVMDNVGAIQISSLSDWIAWQEAAGNTACGGTPGWLGWGWQSGSPTRFLTDEEIAEAEARLETQASTVVVDSSGVESSGTATYYIIVATYEGTTETVTSNDPSVQNSTTGAYTMTTSKINYKGYVDEYTMPFEFLWSFLVLGKDKDLVFELADLVYNSEIEITIYDNLTTITEVETRTYTVTQSVERDGETYEETVTYYRTNTTVTETNTINVSLSKADVWIVDYTQNYTYEVDEETTNESVDEANGVTKTTTIVRKKYVSSPANVIEKTDANSDEPNFVTIFMDYDHYQARTNILSATDWLFEMLEQNEATVDMVDLTKYLLYKATGKSYGVTEYDFSVFDTSNFSSVSITISGNSVEEKVWFALIDAGYSEYAVAGVMGNIYHESRFDNTVVEGGYDEYTGGIGLCQWTNYPRNSGSGRNQQLRDYAASKGVTWQDADTQIEFLISELSPGGAGPAQGYTDYQLLSRNGYDGDSWRNASSPEEAAAAFCWSFERPNSIDTTPRETKAREYYEKYSGTTRSSISTGSTEDTADDIISACYEVTQEFLNRNARYSVAYSDLIYNDIERCWNDSQYLCCATYVSLVLYRSGALSASQIDSYNYHWTGSGGIPSMLEAAGWYQVSLSEAQPGDVAVNFEIHAMIYAGNGTVWDQSSCVISSSGGAPSRTTTTYSNLSACQIWRAP